VRFGLFFPPFDELADVALLGALAAEAEASGWDGVFVWDHVMYGEERAVADPWMALTAIALATERVRLGPLVTPLARRRPWNVARQVAVLDRLSGGRAVLGVGLGGDGHRELSGFGEETDPRARAALLDEALDVVVALWSGAPIDHAGARFRLDRALVLPTPRQAPRPPIWVADVWPARAPLRRAPRFDGVFPISRDEPIAGDDLRALMAYVDERRTSDGPFDLVVTGAPDVSPSRLDELAGAGVTWWLASLRLGAGAQDLRAVAAAGPPQWSR
jgi:alkanesulfonate monooxygenase SsuD/methylene tetrahydromethanopterin reductase-like flavin-dependent oxidoreductase (luciferase family)